MYISGVSASCYPTLLLVIDMSTIKSWYIPMKKIVIALSNSRIPYSSLHWIFGSGIGILLSTIFIKRWNFDIILYSSSVEENWNKLFDESQSNSYSRRIHWQSWSSWSVGWCMMSPQINPSVAIWMNRSSDASFPNFLCESVRLLHICIPNFWHWFPFIGDLPILFPNH